MQYVYLPIFHQPRQHDDDTTLPLIHHLPEVSARLLQWSLGNDEHTLLSVALEEGRKVRRKKNYKNNIRKQK